MEAAPEHKDQLRLQPLKQEPWLLTRGDVQVGLRAAGNPFPSSRPLLFRALARKSKGQKTLLPWMELFHHYWRNIDVRPESGNDWKGRLWYPIPRGWGAWWGAPRCQQGWFSEALSWEKVCGSRGPRLLLGNWDLLSWLPLWLQETCSGYLPSDRSYVSFLVSWNHIDWFFSINYLEVFILTPLGHNALSFLYIPGFD